MLRCELGMHQIIVRANYQVSTWKWTKWSWSVVWQTTDDRITCKCISVNGLLEHNSVKCCWPMTATGLYWFRNQHVEIISVDVRRVMSICCIPDAESFAFIAVNQDCGISAKYTYVLVIFCCFQWQKRHTSMHFVDGPFDDTSACVSFGHSYYCQGCVFMLIIYKVAWMYFVP